MTPIIQREKELLKNFTQREEEQGILKQLLWFPPELLSN